MLGHALDALVEQWISDYLRFADTGKEVEHLSLSITRRSMNVLRRLSKIVNRQHVIGTL
jgi:hypothetical protein